MLAPYPAMSGAHHLKGNVAGGWSTTGNDGDDEDDVLICVLLQMAIKSIEYSVEYRYTIYYSVLITAYYIKHVLTKMKIKPLSTLSLKHYPLPSAKLQVSPGTWGKAPRLELGDKNRTNHPA